MENTNFENKTEPINQEQHSCKGNCKHDKNAHDHKECCGHNGKHHFRPGKFFIGLIVVVFGLALLANNSGYIHLQNINLNWSFFWPIIIILVGLSMLSSRSWLGTILGAIFTLLILAVIFAFAFNSNFNAFTRPGNVISQTRTVSNFNKINLEGIGQLNIIQGDSESMSIEAPENILKNIETKVDDNILEISYEHNWPFIFFNPSNKIKFNVTAKNIDEIKTSGAATINSNEIKSDNLKVEISGAGKAQINVEVKNLETKISGAGDFIINGSAEKENISVSGAGQYNGKNLTSQEAVVRISGAGSATINASQKLDVKISGAGKVDYLGEPKITQEISGAGRINKITQ